MKKVEREKFQKWTEGLLLERDEHGVCKVYDDNDCDEAQAALERGETIQLTALGKVVTEMSLVDGEYRESLIQKDE